MHQDPPKIHWCSVARVLTELVQASCDSHDGISTHPGLLIVIDGGLHGVFWPKLVILDDSVLTGKALK